MYKDVEFRYVYKCLQLKRLKCSYLTKYNYKTAYIAVNNCKFNMKYLEVNAVYIIFMY